MSLTKPRSDTTAKMPVRAPEPPPAGSPGTQRVRAPGASTRERILAYMAEQHVASAAALSRAWGLTAADMRYHLAVLLADGLIEIVPRNPSQPAGRGRPTQCYRLAAKMQPNNLPALCHALLTVLLGSLDAAQRTEVFQAVAESMAGEFIPATNLTRRLSQVVEVLNRAQYRARWEAGAQGPRILLRACPYAAILPQHPELCQLDRALLEHLAQTPLRQTARQDPVTGQPPACIFTVIG